MIQEAVAASINPVIRQPIVDGVLIEGITITTAGLAVSHLLGRQPRGWFVVDKTTDANVWRTAWDSRLLTLDASATTVVSLWIF